MTYLYEFTPDEKRVITAAHARFEQSLSLVAELHNIKGNLTVADDFSGFVAPVATNGAAAPQESK
jgi:hypothetical protein